MQPTITQPAWCHLCGLWRTQLVEVGYAAPAASAPAGAPALRVCAGCAAALAQVARGATRTPAEEPVVYQGVRLRSRRAARWAVFFTTLGLAWHYETRGFVREDGTPYLPDFYLGAWGHWVTISQHPPGPAALALAEAFCHAVGPLLLVAGAPVPERHAIWGWQTLDRGPVLLEYTQADWTRCRDCGGGWWIRSDNCGTYPLAGCGQPTCRVYRWPIRTADVDQAYRRARYARFAPGTASA